MKGITTQRSAERSGTLSGKTGEGRKRSPALSPTAWKRSGHSEHMQSVTRDTEMILKICANRIKWLKQCRFQRKNY